MKFIVIIICFLTVAETFGQKRIEKEIDKGDISQLIIQGNDIFSIKIISEKRETILLVAEVEGEYTSSTLLKVKKENEILKIGKEFTPFFEKDNDKLAAHKVLSFSLILKVPEVMTVSITSDIANVEINGVFHFLSATLEYGTFSAINFLGDATIKTTQGDIFIKSLKPNISGKATSKYGEVINELILSNPYTIEANSTYGNISLLQTN